MATYRNTIHFTTPSADFGRISQRRTYYRAKRLTAAGAERMLRSGAATGQDFDDAPEPCLTARVERVEAILCA